jgi:hypothetical protein
MGKEKFFFAEGYIDFGATMSMGSPSLYPSFGRSNKFVGGKTISS